MPSPEPAGFRGISRTLRTYVHLLDGGLGDADFHDATVSQWGNPRATENPKTAENEDSPDATGLAV